MMSASEFISSTPLEMTEETVQAMGASAVFPYYAGARVNAVDFHEGKCGRGARLWRQLAACPPHHTTRDAFYMHSKDEWTCSHRARVTSFRKVVLTANSPLLLAQTASCSRPPRMTERSTSTAARGSFA